jgi:hypothetical protein
LILSIVEKDEINIVLKKNDERVLTRMVTCSKDLKNDAAKFFKKEK